MRKIALAIIGAALLTATSLAQVNSSDQTATLTATLSESITVDVSGGPVTFTLTKGNATNAGSGALTINTSWILNTGRSLKLYAYFSNTSQALANGTNYIAAAKVEGSFNSGSNAALTGVFGTSGELTTVSITSENFDSSRSDTLALNINLNGVSIPAGEYSGTLHIRAQAT